MVMDFGELKRIVNEQILSRLDHAFVMRRTAESTRVAEQIGCRFGRIVLVDYQPTCENMLADFAARIEANLRPMSSSTPCVCTKRRLRSPSGWPRITDRIR